jgi:hypothetical protein
MLLAVFALQILTVIGVAWYAWRHPRFRQQLRDSLRAIVVFVLGLVLWFGLYLWWHPKEFEQIVDDFHSALTRPNKSE